MRSGEAANRVSRQLGAETVQLIGYSGGGAIVVRMSECTDRLVSLSTIAGNLDPGAWSDHHGYSPLASLLPPGPAASQHSDVIESHWQCTNDHDVPPLTTDT